MTSEMGQESVIANMSWREFEQFIARLFAALGYVDIRLAPGTADEGKDIEMALPVPLGGTMKFLVECKHWQKTSVGRPIVQKLHSAVVTDPTVDGGIIVTSGRFTSGAVEYAERTGIKLLDGDELYRLASKNGIDLAGSAAFAKGNWDRVIADYTEALELNPDDADAYFNRGAIYADLGNYQQAVADYTRAIEIAPDDFPSYYNRGAASAALGDHQQAVADFTKFIELMGADEFAYYNRGAAYAHQGDYQQGIADYTKAIELNPDYAEAYRKRSDAYAALGDYQQASADWTRAVEIRQSGLWTTKKRSKIQRSDDTEASSNRGDWLKKWKRKRSRLQRSDDANPSSNL